MLIFVQLSKKQKVSKTIDILKYVKNKLLRQVLVSLFYNLLTLEMMYEAPTWYLV